MQCFRQKCSHNVCNDKNIVSFLANQEKKRWAFRPHNPFPETKQIKACDKDNYKCPIAPNQKDVWVKVSQPITNGIPNKITQGGVPPDAQKNGVGLFKGYSPG